MLNPPTASQLLADAGVLGQLRRAFDESGVGTDQPIEQGGFIVLNSANDSFEVIRLPARELDSLRYPICADATYNGQRILGSFHTHPNTGTEWRQEPSLQDIHLSQHFPETMGPHQFVIAKEKIYHIDNDGVVTEMGLTRQLLAIREGGVK